MKDLMLIFDVDGTLWDASVQVAESWSMVLKQYDPDLPGISGETMRSLMGRTMDEIAGILLRGVRDEDREDVLERCQKFENEYIIDHGGALYPGVKETLTALQKAGYPVTAVSNCQKGYIHSFFASTGVGGFFCDLEEYGNTGLLKADNIRLVMQRNSRTAAVYIGDTLGDEKSAHEAGIPFVFASYGFGKAENAEAVIRSFAELPEVIKEFE